MGKLAVAVLCFVIIFAVVFSLRNVAGAVDGLVRILVEALGAVVVIVFAIGIAPWLSDTDY